MKKKQAFAKSVCNCKRNYYNQCHKKRATSYHYMKMNHFVSFSENPFFNVKNTSDRVRTLLQD